MGRSEDCHFVLREEWERRRKNLRLGIPKYVLVDVQSRRVLKRISFLMLEKMYRNGMGR